jgi:hypothetical protein
MSAGPRSILLGVRGGGIHPHEDAVRAMGAVAVPPRGRAARWPQVGHMARRRAPRHDRGPPDPRWRHRQVDGFPCGGADARRARRMGRPTEGGWTAGPGLPRWRPASRSGSAAATTPASARCRESEVLAAGGLAVGDGGVAARHAPGAGPTACGWSMTQRGPTTVIEATNAALAVGRRCVLLVGAFVPRHCCLTLSQAGAWNVYEPTSGGSTFRSTGCARRSSTRSVSTGCRRYCCRPKAVGRPS